MSTRSKQEKTGVILMTYGSATTEAFVPEYFTRIYRGRASTTVVDDFKNRYRLIGRSPLVEITERQAMLLEQALGNDYVVRAGMRHSAPFISDAVGACKEQGAEKLIGIILSPQFSSFIMDGYQTAFHGAAEQHGFTVAQTALAKPWPAEPSFIQLLSNRVTEALTALREKYTTSVPIIFTTHSLPEKVVANDPSYLEQLKATVNAVRANLSGEIEWYAGYQSAGHTPEVWLKPDLADIVHDLAQKKKPAVLIVPIQFLSDHLEVLYDLDIKAREECEMQGIAYYRIPLANTDPLFINALQTITKKK